MDFQLTYRRFSERSILVEWPSIIEQNVLDDVLLFKNHLLESNIKSIIQINNAYNTLLIIYESTIDKINDEFLALKELYFSRVSTKKNALRHWWVPVCYEDEFALDLNEICEVKQLRKPELISVHSEAIYTVFFIGFLPGFLYLGGLDERLEFPRKKSPRSHVTKGAVGIGGSQTGIYPNESPGGWNIIGNAPLEFFNPKENRPCFASSGDKITFVPVDIKAYHTIKAQVDNGSYVIKSEVIDG